LDISIIPTIILSKSVSKEIRVILSGDGADELFFGYPRIYNAFWRFIILSFLPLKIKGYLSKFFKYK